MRRCGQRWRKPVQCKKVRLVVAAARRLSGGGEWEACGEGGRRGALVQRCPRTDGEGSVVGAMENSF